MVARLLSGGDNQAAWDGIAATRVFRPVWLTGGLGRVAPHRGQRPQQASQSARHRQRCISAPLQARDLERVPGFRGFLGGFSGSGHAGEGEQKRLDFLAGLSGKDGKDAFQNGPALDKAACPGLALHVGFLVE